MRQSTEVIGIVAAHFEYSCALSFPADGEIEMSFCDGNALIQQRRGKQLSPVEIMFDIPEYPRVTYARPADHDAAHPVFPAIFKGFHRAVDIPVSEDRYSDAGMGCHLCDRRPICLALVHLLAGAAVDGQGLNARILKSHGYLQYPYRIVIPAQSGFDGYRYGYAFYDFGRHGLHFGQIEQNACSGSLAGYLVYRTSVIDVDEFRSGIFCDGCRLPHGVDLVAENLHPDWPFVIVYVEFLNAFFCFADQTFSSNKFGKHQVGAHFLAKRPERRIADILHGGEQQGKAAQVYVSNFDGAHNEFQRKFSRNMKITEYNPLHTSGKNPWILLFSLFLITMGGLFLIGPLLSMVLALLAGGMGVNELQLLLSDPTALPGKRSLVLGIQGATSIGAFIIAPLIFYYTLVKGDISEFFSNTRMTVIAGVLTSGIVFSFMIVNTLFIEWNVNLKLPEFMAGFERWATGLEEQLRELTEYLTRFDSVSYFWLAVLVVAIIPALGEELLFRGLLQNILRQITGKGHLAVWLAAFLFGLLHFQFYGMLPRVLLGALFGYLYLWSGNLLIPVLAHFVNNALSLFFLYLYQAGISSIDVESTEAFPWYYITIFALSGVFLTLRFRKLYASPLKDERMGDRIQGREPGEG